MYTIYCHSDATQLDKNKSLQKTPSTPHPLSCINEDFNQKNVGSKKPIISVHGKFVSNSLRTVEKVYDRSGIRLNYTFELSRDVT